MENKNNYFLIALKHHLNSAKRGYRSQIAKDAKIATSYLSDITSERSYGTEDTRRAIAAACGYPDRAYEDFLDIGRVIYEGTCPSKTKKSEKKINISIAGLTPEKIKTLQAYRDLLLLDNDCIEAITAAIMVLAKKKLKGI